ncbi:MAG: OmpA family protein [Myxococcota bacterium]|jgi:flagellar motor protein MotB|nr:OmpA family protein [Myxococcota bacterium]
MGRKRKPEPEEVETDAFVVMMTSLSMIMLAFFIVMNSLATITQIKVMKALDSLYGSFGPLSGGKSTTAGPLSIKEKENEDKKPDKEKVYKSLLERADLDPSIELLERDDSFTLALQDDVLFETGLNRISPRMFRSLNSVAQVIKEVGLPVRVVGYSDATPSNGNETNLMLSLKRAVLVMNYLMYAGRVPRELLIVEGRGEELSPHFVSKSGEAISVSDARRRRVEIVWGLD